MLLVFIYQRLYLFGDGLVCPTRLAGSGTLHTHDVVHGVTELTGGVRYSLFLCDTLAPSEAHLTIPENVLHTAALTRDYFNTVLPFLQSINSQQLSEIVQDYVKFLLTLTPEEAMEGPGEFNGINHLDRALSVRSLGVDLAWRIHTLHPLSYARTAGLLVRQSASKDSTDFLDLDLVEAIKRQMGFMRDILEHPGSESPHALQEAFTGYRKFLISLRELSYGVPEDTLVDLMWHSHMQYPARYAQDCVKFVGTVVEHDDDL